MARSPGHERERERDQVEELFARPPAGSAELEWRLRGVDLAALRAVLVDRLEAGTDNEADYALYVELFEVVGVDDEEARLRALFLAPGTSPSTRATVLAALSAGHPALALGLLEAIGTEERLAVIDLPVLQLLAQIQRDPASAETLTALLLGVESEDIVALGAEQVERCRKAAGTPAAAAYGHALRVPDLRSLHGPMLDEIVREGGEAGAALLQRLRDEAPEPEVRRRLQGSLLRLRTHEVEAAAKGLCREAPGSAWLATCDGLGAFLVLARVDNPDGSFSTVTAVVRAGAELRDTAVYPRHTEDELAAMRREMSVSAGAEFVELSLAAAAELVLDAARRTRRMGLAVPESDGCALALLDRAADGRAVEPPPAGAPPTRDELREMLGRPACASWFFDSGDLAHAGVELPEAPDAKWFREAAARMDSPEVRARLRGMAEHMALWHALAGEAAAARAWGGVAREAERRFRRSGLLRVMLERSLDPPEAELVDIGAAVGETGLRHALRAGLFGEVDPPLGRDLARLDLTEALTLALEWMVEALPAQRRPRWDQHQAMALVLAESMLPLLFRRSITEKQVRLAVSRSASELARVSNLGAEERSALARLAVQVAADFTCEVCSACPVDCLSRPEEDVSDAFFADRHPSASGPEAEDEPGTGG